MLWTTGGYGVGQALRLATNLIVTRLLTPEAFGLMAIVDTLLIGAQMVSDTGIVQTLVQRKDPPGRDLLNTAWAIHALRGLALFGVLALFARPIASWYGRARAGRASDARAPPRWCSKGCGRRASSSPRARWRSGVWSCST